MTGSSISSTEPNVDNKEITQIIETEPTNSPSESIATVTNSAPESSVTLQTTTSQIISDSSSTSVASTVNIETEMLTTSEMSTLTTNAETSMMSTSVTESQTEEASTSNTDSSTVETTMPSTTEGIETLERRKKSVDFLFTSPSSYADDYLVYRSFDIGVELPEQPVDDNMFLVNGLRNIQVNLFYINYK